MRKGFFFSFIILSCVQVLSISALEYLHKLEDQDLKVSKYYMVVQEKKATNGSEHMNDDAEEVAAKHYAVLPEKFQKGRGSTGGANVVHHRPEQRSAASILQSPFVFIQTSTVCIYLLFLLVFPLLIV